MTTYRFLTVLWWTLAVGAASCGSDDWGLDEAPSVEDPRFDELRGRLAIEVVPGLNGYAGDPGCSELSDRTTPCCSTSFCSAAGLANFIRNGTCLGSPGRFTNGSCGSTVVLAEREVCVAHTLLEIVESPSAHALVAVGGQQTLIVPAQDAESNGELAVAALQRASNALILSGSGLVLPAICAGVPDPPTAPPPIRALNHPAGDDSFLARASFADGHQLTFGEELAGFYVEALDISQSAAILAAENGAAVSDQELSGATDPADASLMRIAPFASRVHAAHVLIGGSSGLRAMPRVGTEGFFTLPRLSTAGAHALRVIRAAGPHPNWVLATSITLPAFLEDPSGIEEDGIDDSIVQRLADQLVEPAPTFDRAAWFYDRSGTTADAVAEARAWLAQEITAFARAHSSAARSLPPERLPSGGTAPYRMWAATRLPPEQPLDAFWATMLRYQASPVPVADPAVLPAWNFFPTVAGTTTRHPAGDTWGDITTVAGQAVPTRTGGVTVAALIRRVANPAVRARLTPLSGTSMVAVNTNDSFRAARAEINEGLATAGLAFDDAETTERIESSGLTSGYARACYRQVGTAAAELRLDLDLTRSPIRGAVGIRVLRHAAALECAVRGRIDGVGCTASELTTGSYPVSFADDATAPAGTYRANVQFTPFTLPRVATGVPDQFYIVAPRAGAPETPGPGDFEAITGFALDYPLGSGTGWTSCVSATIAPELDRRAAELVGPSTEYAARSATNCAGLPDDLKIPLENELTDDRDGVETSWRHYLSRAREAGDTADALAEDLIRTGLEMDLRAEAQADELERICGVRINVTGFAGDLPDREIPVPDGGCTGGYVASGAAPDERCILDPIAWAESSGAVRSEDARRLAACIGSEATVPWVALGDQPLCAWQYPGVPDSVCRGADSTHPCPALVPSGGCTRVPLPGPIMAGTMMVNAAPIDISRALGLFTQPYPPLPPPPDTASLPCASLGRIAAGRPIVGEPDGLFPGVNIDALRVLESGLLTQNTFRDLARELNFEASAGDYARVSYGNSTIATTGALTVSGSLAMWPAGDRINNVPVLGVAPSMGAPVDPETRLCWNASGMPASGSTTNDPSANLTDGIFCVANVAGGSNERERRARTNNMLGRAVIAARAIAGLPMTGIVVPYYPATTADTVQIVDADMRLVAGDYYTSDGGILSIDHFASADSAGAETSPLTDFGASAHDLRTGPEWLDCPYEGGVCTSFDRARGLGDGARDRDLYLMLRELPAETAVNDAEPRVAGLWGDGGAIYVNQIAPEFSVDRVSWRLGEQLVLGVQLSRVSDYFAVGVRRRIGCDERGYGDCLRLEGEIDFRSTAEGNSAYMGPTRAGGHVAGISLRDVMNGLELTCVGARSASPSANFGCDVPPQINSMLDLLNAQAFLNCRAERIRDIAARTVIRNLPVGVIDALAPGPGTLGATEGEIAEEVANLRAAVIALSDAEYAIADDLRGVGTEVSQLRTAIARSEIAHEVENLTLTSTIFDRVTSCAVAVSEAASDATNLKPLSYVTAGITCANAGVQVGISAALSGLRHRELGLELEGTFASFDSSVTLRMRSMSERVISIRTQLEAIDAALARINQRRAEGRRALARALYLESDGTAGHFAVSSAYRNRYSTTLARYREAHTRAVRTAYIARRAIEQRLAMPLDSITEDLVTVEAPATWADEICTMPSVDYDRIRMSAPGPTGEREGDSSALVVREGYSGAYVGDYVRRLEEVVNSYNFAFPFRDGTDTVVMSLRDDVFRVPGLCPTPGPNLLLQSNHLDALLSSTAPGWEVTGCDASLVPRPADGDDPEPWLAHCASATALDVDDDPPAGVLETGGIDLGRARGFRVQFGGSPAALSDVAYTQAIELPEGRYRVSWFGREPTGVPEGSALEPKTVVTLLDPAGDEAYVGTRAITPPVTEPLTGGWSRFHFFADIRGDGPSTLVLSPGTLPSGATRFADIAGLMVEDVTASVDGDPWRTVTFPDGTMGVLATREGPGPYFATAETTERLTRSCVDIDGTRFREEVWTYGCIPVCPDGYGATCDPEIAGERCYYQASFSASSDLFERVLTGTPTGFASGNYNYRIDTVAVNIVGENVRNCDLDPSPSCFASGNIAYSLLHDGPFWVGNARGESYLAPLFPGRIESARALMAERYVTNPLSGADMSLIGSYTRPDFAGRPLAGTMILRIWDEPSLDFSQIQDVQLIFGYRYWQHQR
jgi:hypothetical protein